MTNAPHYIAVDGPLLVGKTLLARTLADRMHGRTVLDADDNPHLEAFQQGRPGAAFRAQMHFLYHRFRGLEEASIPEARMPVVTDYLIEKDKIYAYLNLSDDELEVYETFYSFLKERLSAPDLAIYLRATAETIHERLASIEPRSGSRISAAYLDGTVRAFDHFFSRYKASEVLVIDCRETDIVGRHEDLERVVEELGRPGVGTQLFLPLEP